MKESTLRRAAVHAALGDPVRLAIIDDLAVSDRSPGELGTRFGLSSNLLAHHLEVLERVGLISRLVSSGDRRRRYVRLNPELPPGVGNTLFESPKRVVFICTHNSARSQLATVLWRQIVGGEVESAGTHPSERVHPGAVAAADRAGLSLAGASPRGLEEVDMRDGLVVTVCDRAHEELTPGETWWHWSTPDPVEDQSLGAFERTLARLQQRITTVMGRDAGSNGDC